MTHYLGKTGRIAASIYTRLPALQRGDGEVLTRCLLFTGEPGIGKTSLAIDLAAAISGDKVDAIRMGRAFCVETCNGQSCTIERVRQWRYSQCYRPITGTGTGVYLVDEIDGAGPAACNELRSFLDNLYPGRVFIATTNKKPEELQEQLQSRFKTYRFDPVPEHEIAGWLLLQFPLLTPQMAADTAKGVRGNVRAARADALTLVEALEVA